ncbi:MAG: VanZ family protein [Roseburia sp.]|nr:VanZ family protein [Roseburia sp.]
MLLCATLARDGYERIVKIQPFSSYMAAWNSASSSEWRNLFINILLFIPLGFLLPLLSAKWNKCWKTYACGALTALLIECLQFTFHRGIVEFDDFLNNTLGTVIGYGFSQIVYAIADALKNKKKICSVRLALYQIPFAVVIAGYVIFFFLYSQLQLGTLPCRYSEIVNMSQIKVESDREITANETENYVYIGTLMSEKESALFAADYFQKLGDELDETQNNYYENTAMFKSKSMQYILTVTYRGGGYELTDFGSDAEEETSFSARTSDLSAEKIKSLLQQYHVTVPNQADFAELGDGEYQFAIHMKKEGDCWYDGVCTVIPAKNQWLSHLNYHIFCFSDEKTIDIKSEQQAYKELKEGKFIIPEEMDNIADITSLCIKDITIVYELDSRGYAQPVYEFHVAVNQDKNNMVQIKIPAI